MILREKKLNRIIFGYWTELRVTEASAYYNLLECCVYRNKYTKIESEVND
jgi:hypothetical protein